MSRIETFFSILFLAGVIWTLGFLLPMARRDRDPFEIVCTIVAAVIALAAWLLLAAGVHSQ